MVEAAGGGEGFIVADGAAEEVGDVEVIGLAGGLVGGVFNDS